MISVVLNNLASHLICKEEDSDSLHVDDSLWMPAGIGIVNRKSVSDVITIKLKLSLLIVPKLWLFIRQYQKLDRIALWYLVKRL